MKFYKAIEKTDTFSEYGDALIPEDIVAFYMTNTERKEILCTHYGMTDVTNKYQEDIATVLEVACWDGIFTSFFYNITNRKLFLHIDLYEARESCCGPEYKELIDKWIPKEKQKEMVSIFTA